MLSVLLSSLLLLQDPVSASATVSAETVEIGGTVDVLVTLDVDSGWHVYHPDQDPMLGIPVSMDIAGDGLTAGNTVSESAPMPHVENIGGQELVYLWLDGSPVFRVPVTVDGPAGTREIEVTANWQVCDDSVCLPPESADFTLTVEVQAPAGLQPQTQAGEHVSATVSIDRGKVAPGEELTIRVDFAVDSGWHIYHPDQDPMLGIPLSVEVSNADVTTGALSGSAEPTEHLETIGGEFLTYLWVDGNATFELPVQFSGAEGERDLQITVGWQVCDDSVCLAPTTHDFSFPVTVEGAAVATAGSQAGGVQVPPAEDEKALEDLFGEVTPSWVGVEGEAIEDGAVLDLVFELDIIDGWHVYHPDQDPSYGIPVSIEILGQGLTALGEAVAVSEPEVHAEPIGDEVWEYLWLSGKTQLKQRVKIDGDPAKINARAVVRWQACDDSFCKDQEAYGFSIDRSSMGSFALAKGDVQGALNDGLWAFILAAAAAGFATLFTPCVFPMIPITISFFTKRAEQGKGSALGNAAAYGGGIVLTFVGLGLGAAVLLGVSGANDIASNPWLNVGLAGLFLFFAFSLLGFYEINAPKWMQNMASKTQAEGQNKSGYMPVVFMAVAFSVTAFTCTVGFVGGVLALGASSGEWFYPVIGMTVYALVFATPFFLLAMFPTMMKGLPQAGGWMNAVKVTLGYIEMIAAWKFLSNADRSWNWELLTRPVVITLTAIPLALAAAYLFGLYRTKHDFEKPKPGKARMVTGVVFLGMTLFVVNGYRTDSYPGGAEGFFPPLAYGVHDVDDEGREMGPARLGWYDNYPEAFEAALEKDRVLFLDFTGITCVNCLRMEGNIFPVESVRSRLEQVERAHLWVDKAPHGAFNKELQFREFNSQQQPQYVLIDPRDNVVLGIFNGYKPDPQLFADFLQKGLDDYTGRTPGAPRPRFTMTEPVAKAEEARLSEEK